MIKRLFFCLESLKSICYSVLILWCFFYCYILCAIFIDKGFMTGDCVPSVGASPSVFYTTGLSFLARKGFHVIEFTGRKRDEMQSD